MKPPLLTWLPLSCALVLLAGAPAHAAQSEPSSLEAEQAGDKAHETGDDQAGDKADKKSKSDKGEKGGKDDKSGKLDIDVKGRVFALAEYVRDVQDGGLGQFNQNAFALSIPSARAGLRVKLLEQYSLVLEADFAGRASIKDGYIQAKGKRYLVRAGRFKMPISAFTLESPWTLPRTHRGQLDDLLSEHMLLSGRREGVMGRLQGGGYWDPALTIGAFQSVAWGQAEGDPIAMQTPKDTTVVARVSVEPSGAELALVGQRLVTLVGVNRAYYSGGLEGTSEHVFAASALRLWAEGLIGQTWFGHTAGVVDMATAAAAPAHVFFEARVMAAYRLGGLERGANYGEVFFSGGMLDPDTDVTQDQFFEISGGVNVGHWLQTRLTLEIVHGRAARNFPASYFRDFGQPTIVRHTAALLQAGVAF